MQTHDSFLTFTSTFDRFFLPQIFVIDIYKYPSVLTFRYWRRFLIQMQKVGTELGLRGFRLRHEVEGDCALLGYYVVSSE